MISGLSRALIVTLPACIHVTVGVKITLTMQLAPASTIPPLGAGNSGRGREVAAHR